MHQPSWQQQSGTTETLAWEHRDTSNASVRIPGAAAVESGSAELDPLGMNAGALHLVAPPPPAYHPPLKEARSYPGFADPGGGQCRVDGIDVPCGMISSEMAVHCPNNDCGPQVISGELVPFIAYDDGSSSFDHAGESIGYYPDGVPKGGRKTRRKADDSFDHAYNPQNPTYPPPINLRADVERLLMKRACANFVESVINKVFELFPDQPFYSDDALHLYDTINSQGGFKFEQAMAGGKPLMGLASGYIDNLPGPNNSTPGQRMATVTITRLPTNNPNSGNANNARISYTLTALGEITHFAGSPFRYTDRELAIAASKVTGIPGLPETDDIDANSNYYHHKVLNIICDPRSK